MRTLGAKVSKKARGTPAQAEQMMQTLRTAQPALLRPTVISLIAANAVPLAGVVLLGWDLRAVLLLFWAESAVIGVYNVVKMLTVGGWRAIPLCVFFTVHYGGFMAGHLVFLIALTSGEAFGRGGRGPDASGLGMSVRESLDGWFWLGVAALFVSHGVSFAVHFVRGGERPGDYKELMTKPYGRIIVMHVSIILGAALVLMTGRNAAMLALLVVLKIGVDVHAHLREHRKVGRPADEGGPDA